MGGGGVCMCRDTTFEFECTCERALKWDRDQKERNDNDIPWTQCRDCVAWQGVWWGFGFTRIPLKLELWFRLKSHITVFVAIGTNTYMGNLNNSLFFSRRSNSYHGSQSTLTRTQIHTPHIKHNGETDKKTKRRCFLEREHKSEHDSSNIHGMAWHGTHTNNHNHTHNKRQWRLFSSKAY